MLQPALDASAASVVPYREFALVACAAAAVTFLLGGVVRRFAIRMGAMAWPRGRDVHAIPTPRWGGLAIVAGVLAGVVTAYQLPAMRLAFDYSDEVPGTMLAVVVLAVVGLLDDRFDLDALTKFAGQITAACILVVFGVQWTLFWVPWGGNPGQVISLGFEQGAFLTVLLVIALINALNFVDGLDGLASGVAMIASGATGLFAIGLIIRGGNDPFLFSPALLASVLFGACLGFLPHNFNPARIFMGDSGSMPIGLLVATSITMSSGRIPPTDVDSSDILALFAPVLVLAAVVFVPLLDLLMAVIRRTRKGLSPFAPDKMHLHHRLLEIGHSHRRAVLLIYMWAAVLAFGAVALTLIDNPAVVLVTTAIGLLCAGLATAVPRLRRLTALSIQAVAPPVVPPAGEHSGEGQDDAPTLPVHPEGGPGTRSSRTGHVAHVGPVDPRLSQVKGRRSSP